MFSSSVGRIVRSTCSVPTSSTACPRTLLLPATSRAAASTAPGSRAHQRRLSSSKAPSCPPDGPKGPATAQQAAGGNSSTRTGRRKAKDAAAVVALKTKRNSYPNLPSVPPTKHLEESDVTLSTFFSLHRPISVTTPVPTASTDAAFNTMFEPRTPNNNKFGDVIYTVGSAVESLEAASGEETDLRWEVLQESSSNAEPVKHLDGAPKGHVSLEKLISQFRPFRVPPAPVPFDMTAESQPKRVEKREARARRVARPKQKSWSTTIVVTESTFEDGQKTYTAATSPIVRVPVPPRADIVDPVTGRRRIQQPFLERMRVRQQRWEEYRQDRATEKGREMLLISVKRQRKLKMKKHKYKKLMKRTRNLRRRLDRN